MKRITALLLVILMALNLNTCSGNELLPPPDYISIMIDAAVSGDMEKGHAAQEAELQLFDKEPGKTGFIDFDEFFLLSKFICADAGKRLHSEEFLMCVGEVILNRTASPEFPDSIRDVIFDEGQYEFVNTEDFKELLPERACCEAAMKLLQGQRLMKSSVVFKSKLELGKVYASFCDRVQGFTYFCESPNQELYTLQDYPRKPESLRRSGNSAPNVSVSADSFRDYKDNSIIVVKETSP